MAQFLRPASDDNNTGAYSPTPLWQQLDEVTADDNTTVVSSANNPAEADGTGFEVGLSSVTDPAVGTGHTIRIRAKQTAGARDITLHWRLYEGAAPRAAERTVDLSTNKNVYFSDAYALSVAEADAIGNYASLSFRVWGTTAGSGQPSVLVVTWGEMEVPDAPLADPTRGRVSWAEMQAPFQATRGRVSWAELEAPLAPTRGRVSWAELEAPFVSTRGRVSWSELEAPFQATRGRVSWVELEVPTTLTRGRISWAELEAPTTLTRGRVSWAELQVPDLAVGDPTRGRISWAELESPFVATQGRISWAELETPLVSTRGRISWAELESPLAPTRGLVSWSELQVPTAQTRGRISWVELVTPDVASGKKRHGGMYSSVVIFDLPRFSPSGGGVSGLDG